MKQFFYGVLFLAAYIVVIDVVRFTIKLIKTIKDNLNK